MNGIDAKNLAFLIRLRVHGFMGVIIALSLLTFTGCSSISYLSHVTAGHLRIMYSRLPIKDVLTTDQLSIESRNKLKLVLEVRSYGSDALGLPRNKSYTVYSQISGPYLGWNVYAAPRFSVEPTTWCFPIAGCVMYQGFFSEKAALEFLKKTKEKDLDVFIWPFTGYSTLGWWDDPVVSSQLTMDPIHLAGMIIHELAHQLLYVPGDSRFSEAFAVTVERAGVLQWLKSSGRDALVPQALDIWLKEDLMASIVLKTRTQLMDLYRTETDAESLQQKKIALFHGLKEDLRQMSCSGTNLSKVCDPDFEPNNAFLVPLDTYYSLVPLFRSILDSLGGDLPQFYSIVKQIGDLPFEKRQREIESLKRNLKRVVTSQGSHFTNVPQSSPEPQT
jgi:predicted aminopeptidase